MGGRFNYAGAVSRLPGWDLLFAKEPEADVHLELEERGTAHNQPSPFGAPAPQKPPHLRILILIILLLVVAGGAYFSMDPELVMKLSGQEPVPALAPPPVTAVRRPIVPAPSPSPRTMDPEGLDVIIPPGAIPIPSFGEGQRVSVVPNSASPGLPLSLSQDAAGTKPGPMVGAGRTLLVLDAELLDNTWVYLVRTDEGAKGWMAEKQLAVKP
ncbi:MAG: hypothetical protein H0W13_04830 [Nitrospirales bacterium]|nr:hypothetical protein [Nitrospirales bacterium]